MFICDYDGLVSFLALKYVYLYEYEFFLAK